MLDESDSSANKRIAKNTVFLYLRMLVSLLIGLYTSRVILNALGVEDYGIYNVVGGLISITSFLTSSLSASTQRFLSTALGQEDEDRLDLVFNTAVTIHFFLALIIFVLAETVGLWFVNTYINIPESKLYAANWVYQCTLIAFILNVMTVPYISAIIAHEHMKAFAYIGILATFLNLGIALVVFVLKDNKLIYYSIMVLALSVLQRLLFGIYSKKHFREIKYHFTFDKGLMKEMFAFTGWSFLGASGFSLRDQLSNIMLNMFFGPAINAARGIATQANNAIQNFSTNFMMAMNPQIMKQYSSGNVQRSMELVYSGSRYSFYLMSLVALPVLVNLDYVLKLWLGKVPQYAYQFLLLLLIAALINSFAQPLVTALQATGKIKKFQIMISIILLSEIPIAFVILKCGGAPYMAAYPTVLVMFVALFERFKLLKELVPEYDFKYFAVEVFLKSSLMFVVSFGLAKGIQMILPENFLCFLLTSAIVCSLWCVLLYFFGLSNSEKGFILKKIKSYV